MREMRRRLSSMRATWLQVRAYCVALTLCFVHAHHLLSCSVMTDGEMLSLARSVNGWVIMST
jgi:hypothetical protein